MAMILINNYYNGVDWLNYIKYYNGIKDEGLDYILALRYEIGFLGINYIFANFFEFENFHGMVVFISLVFLFSLYLTLAKVELDFDRSYFILLTLCLLVPLFSDGYRQLLAYAIISPFLVRIRDLTLIKWLILCVVAALFHLSAILFFPFWFFLRKKLKLVLYFLLWGALAIILITFNFYFDKVDFIFPAFIASKISVYLEKLQGNLRLGLFGILDIVAIISLLLMKREKRDSLYWNASFLFFTLHLLFYLAPFLQRALIYISPLLIINVSFYRQSYKHLLLAIIISLCAFGSFYRYVTNPYFGSDFYSPNIYILQMFESNEVNINNLAAEKCAHISALDPEFCNL